MERAFDLPLTAVDPASIMLRKVNTDSIQYLELVQDLKNDGHFGNSIIVRPVRRRYEVVDGMYRWTAAKEVGLEYIQAIVRDMTDDEVIVWQVKLNSGQKPTDLIDYARHLERLRRLKPDMRIRDLVIELGKNRRWIYDILKLNNLNEKASTAVRRGEITLGNARLLAKLKKHLQNGFIDEAKVDSFSKFSEKVADAVNDYRENIKMGKIDAHYNGEIKPYLRPIREIREELSDWTEAGKMLSKYNCRTPLEGWQLAIKWMMNIDDENIERRRKKLQCRDLREFQQGD